MGASSRLVPCVRIAVACVCILAAVCCGQARAADAPAVVVFTSLDRVFSDPILQQFQARTGITVRAVFDAEAAKTTGLVNRLIARRDRPECDVLWNNEIVQMQQLAQRGLLEPYASPQAQRFPAQFRDPQNRWTGFAARMRVLIYNTQRLSPQQAPKSLADLTDPQWRGQAAIARPFFGTTLTHMAALEQLWGPDKLRAYLRALRDNDVALCPGNATVRDLVASGERCFGLTDTDDAYGAMLDGKPVAVAIPDSADGAVLIPNTVAVIAGCPNPDSARKLVDYLLLAEVERTLAASRSAQIPLACDLADVATPWQDLRRVPAMKFDVGRGAAALPKLVELLKQEQMDR